jgi:predicted ester cyclase
MRTFVTIILILAIAFGSGCSTSESKNTTSARQLFEQYVIEFWVKRDTTALDRALSPTMIYHYNGSVIPGDPASHLNYLQTFGGAFPDLTATIDVFTISGDIGAAVTTWTGTQTGTLCQIAGTNKKVTWVVNYVFRIDAGRIVELWEAWDEGGIYSKLGIDASKCDG